jgi:peptide/nickel transport system ATP-binding protein
MSNPILHIDNLHCEYGARARDRICAINGLSLRLFPGETVALVGEEGSGRTTLARAVLQLLRPAGGRLVCDGQDLLQLGGASRREARKGIQWVPGCARETFDPAWSLRRSLHEPLLASATGSTEPVGDRIAEAADLAALPPDTLDRLPGQLDDATLGHAALARALVPRPRLIVCDEPGVGLDDDAANALSRVLASVIRTRFVACLLLTADFSMAARIADRIGVLYLGHLIEIGPAGGVWEWPLHPYTASLVSALDRVRKLPGPPRPSVTLSGGLPPGGKIPPGCLLFPRCPKAEPERCAKEIPVLRKLGFAQRAACHYAVPPVDPDDPPDDGPSQGPPT